MLNNRQHALYAIILLGFLAYLGSIVFLLAIDHGHSINSNQNKFTDSFAATMQMDARNYQRVVEEGYRYDEAKRSMVAFFPLYPKLCSLLVQLTGWRSDACMLLIANLFLILTLIVIYFLGSSLESTEWEWSLAVFCLFPSTFFFRMGYAESMLCFFVALALLGIQRRWPIWVLALLAGFASGTRPVGIAVSAAVCWYVLFSKAPSPSVPLPGGEKGASNPSPFAKYFNLLWIIPLSCWGLLAYMAYLWWAFDAPLAFAQTQEHWTFLAPKNYTFWDKVWSLITLEPIWNVYHPDSQRFWMRGDAQDNPLFSCLFWNPIFYLFTWFLIILGWWKKWLKDYEIVLSVGLLLIPYVTRAYEMSMASHARFAAVVIPQYFVLGRLFAMLPPAIAGCLCGLMGLMLGLWTALFVAGYRFF